MQTNPSAQERGGGRRFAGLNCVHAQALSKTFIRWWKKNWSC